MRLSIVDRYLEIHLRWKRSEADRRAWDGGGKSKDQQIVFVERDHRFCFADLFSEKMMSDLVLSCTGMVMVETQRLENLLAAFWAFEERATCVISNRDRHTLCRWLCTRCLGLPEKVGQWDPWCLVIWSLIVWLMGWLLGSDQGVMQTSCSQCPSTSGNATGNSRGEGLERYSARKSGCLLRLTQMFQNFGGHDFCVILVEQLLVTCFFLACFSFFVFFPFLGHDLSDLTRGPRCLGTELSFHDP